MSPDPIARQLRAARLAARRSQKSVGDEIGVVQSNVSEWENGVTNPTLSSLRSWARALDHTLVLLPVSGPGSTSPEPGPTSVTPTIPAFGPDDQLGVLTNVVCDCAAHGPHPHNGMRCLDCLPCVSGHSTEDGAAT